MKITREIIESLSHTYDERIDLSSLAKSSKNIDDYPAIDDNYIGLDVSAEGIEINWRGGDISLPTNLSTEDYIDIAYRDDVSALRDLYATLRMARNCELDYEDISDICDDMDTTEYRVADRICADYYGHGLSKMDCGEYVGNNWHWVTRLSDWTRTRAMKYLCECTDDQIAELEAEIAANAREAGIHLTDSYGYLTTIRDNNLNCETGDRLGVKKYWETDSDYGITYTDDMLQIGCQDHPLDEWCEIDSALIDRIGQPGDAALWEKHRLRIFFAMSRYHSRFGVSE